MQVFKVIRDLMGLKVIKVFRDIKVYRVIKVLRVAPVLAGHKDHRDREVLRDQPVRQAQLVYQDFLRH